jgi:hypothetical protein
MGELIAAATVVVTAIGVVVTAVGVWFAHNYRRQVTLKLSETRLEAYSCLWQISGVAAPTRLDGWGDDGYLQLDERRDLWAAMTDWYYANGGGMLLTATTKDVYLSVKHNLICKSSDLRPAGLAGRINGQLGLSTGLDLDDKVRGTLAIRLISLLRTQLKSDLAIYGATYSGKLDEYERFFLEESDVDLGSKAWAKAAGLDTRWHRWRWRWRKQWRRRRRPAFPDGSPKVNPQTSPLQGMSAILNVGGLPQTPPSSCIAVGNALKGPVVGSAGEAKPSQVFTGERPNGQPPEQSGN